MGFTQKASCRPYKNCYRKKKGGNKPVRYIVSSHGEELKTKFEIPKGVEVHFYVPPGEILYCALENEMDVCRGKTAPYVYFEETFMKDYKLTPTKPGENWVARVSKCALDDEMVNKIPLFPINGATTLSQVVNQIINTQRPTEKIEVHCLFCRVE